MTDRNKVLVVDDNLLICRQIELAFKEEPIQIFEAHTGMEALEKIETEKPGLILLDVILPDIEGYDLVGKIKDREHTDIIFITSKDKDEDVVRGFSLGACDYIKKPFRSGEVKSRVMAHLEIRKKQEELEKMNRTFQANVEKLNSMVYRDELTGLYNRRYVTERLASRLAKTDDDVIMVMIDIDDFKKVNDSYGHQAGDMAMICISSMMETIFHDYTVTRWGGEEFLIILSGADLESTGKLCEQLRTEVAEFAFEHGNITFFCTITLGVAKYCRSLDLNENVALADEALYLGKKSGKNQIAFYADDRKPGSDQ